MTVALAVVSAVLVVCGATVWADRVGAETLRQRQLLLSFVYEQKDWPLLRLELDAVLYRQHYLAVLLRRDPARLYSPRLAAVMRARRPA